MKTIRLFLSIAIAAMIFGACTSENDDVSSVTNAKTRGMDQTSTDSYYYYNRERISVELDSLCCYLIFPSEKAEIIQAGLKKIIKQDCELEKLPENRTASYVPKEYLGTMLKFALENGLSKAELAIESVVKEDTARVGMSNSFYVKLKSHRDLQQLKDLASSLKCKIEGLTMPGKTWYTLICDANSLYNSVEASNYIFESGKVEDVDPGFFMTIGFDEGYTGHDAFVNNQWYLEGANGIDAYKAWELSKGSSEVTVAVFDTGFDESRADVNGRIVGSYDCVTGGTGQVYSDDHYHGIQCATIIGASHNGAGYAGIAPEVSMANISMPSGILESSDIANGFNWALNNDVSVINCSWHLHDSERSSLISSAITSFLTDGNQNRGGIICFAAGNDPYGNFSMHYPASDFDDLIVVGASTNYGTVADFSMTGPTLDLVAPGEGLPWWDGSGNNAHGTSFASPIVAATAALMLSENQTLTRSQIENIINHTTTTSHSSWGDYYGYGLANTYRAVKAAKKDYIIESEPQGLYHGVGAYSRNCTFEINDLPRNAQVTWRTTSNTATIAVINPIPNVRISLSYPPGNNIIDDTVTATIRYAGITVTKSKNITIVPYL